MNHEDRFEEIRVSIIEGTVPGQEHRPGYSVHICADPEALCAHATLDDWDEYLVDPSKRAAALDRYHDYVYQWY